MIRKVVGFVAWVGLTLALGCGSGVSEKDAQLRCDQEKQNNASACVDDNAYNQCLTCQEDCGDQCVRLESCPVQFTCPK